MWPADTVQFPTFSFPPYNLIPEAYSKLHSEDASYYAQALFSLAERELGYINSFSADLMYSYWKFMTANWQHLCDDISRGHIGDHIDMPEDVKEELSRHLPADPARAEELREAIRGGIKGLAKRVWPTMNFIIMGKSAAFKVSMSNDLGSKINFLESGSGWSLLFAWTFFKSDQIVISYL